MPFLLGRRTVVALALSIASLFVAERSHAYCRTTTKALPPNYNPTQGCYTDGLLLWWKNACLGYSVNQRASDRITFDTATQIVDKAFARWSNAKCADTSEKVGIDLSNNGP